MSRVAVVTGAARGSAPPRCAGWPPPGGRWWPSTGAPTTPGSPIRWAPGPSSTRWWHGPGTHSATGPGRVVAHVADTTDEAGLGAAVADAEDRFGGLDAVVAVAGVIAGGVPLWEMPADQLAAVLDVDLAVRSPPPGWVSRPCSAGPRPAPGPLPGRRLGGRHQGTAPAGRLRRGQGRRGRTGPRPGRRPGRHRDHRQRRLPRVDRHGHARRECPPLRPRRAPRPFADQQPVGRLLAPEEVAAALVWLAGEPTGGPSPGPSSRWTVASVL